MAKAPCADIMVMFMSVTGKTILWTVQAFCKKALAAQKFMVSGKTAFLSLKKLILLESLQTRQSLLQSLLEYN